MEKDNRVEEINAANDFSDSDDDFTPRNAAAAKAAPEGMFHTAPLSYSRMQLRKEYISMRRKKFLFLIASYLVATIAFCNYADLWGGPTKIEKAIWGNEWLPTFDHVVIGTTGFINMWLLCCAVTGRIQKMYAIFASIIYLASSITHTVLGFQNYWPTAEQMRAELPLNSKGEPKMTLEECANQVYYSLIVSLVCSVILTLIGFTSSWMLAWSIAQMRKMETQLKTQHAALTAQKQPTVEQNNDGSV